MSTINSPCYGCNNRALGCHSSCESYMSFQAENAEENEKIRKNKAKSARKIYMSDRDFRNAKKSSNKNRVFKQTRK